MRVTTPRGQYIWPNDYLSPITFDEARSVWVYTRPRAAGAPEECECDLIERKGVGNVMGHQLQHDPVWMLLQDWAYVTSTGSLEDTRELLNCLVVAAAWDQRKLITPQLNQITYAIKNNADLLEVADYIKEIDRLKGVIVKLESRLEDRAVEEGRARRDEDYLAVVPPKGSGKNASKKSTPKA